MRTFLQLARVGGICAAMIGATTLGAASDTPLDLERQIERAIRREVEAQIPTGSRATFASARPFFRDGVLSQEITVSDSYRDLLILPDYRQLGRTIKGFGVPRGGSSGSPSFDVFTRRYWWE